MIVLTKFPCHITVRKNFANNLMQINSNSVCDCLLLVTIAESFDPDQGQKNVLAFSWSKPFDIMMIFLKYFSNHADFVKKKHNQQTTKTAYKGVNFQMINLNALANEVIVNILIHDIRFHIIKNIKLIFKKKRVHTSLKNDSLQL